MTRDPNTKPSLWTWTGDGNDLKIQRINMTSWFSQVVLNNVGSGAGRYSVDSGTAQTFTSPATTWLLQGSLVYLWSQSGGSDAITGGLQSTETVDASLSFVYDTGVWRSDLFSSQGGRQLKGYDLQAAVNSFALAAANPNAASGATQTGLSTEMQTFMTAYLNWVSASFPSSGSTKTALTTSQSSLATIATNLIKHP